MLGTAISAPTFNGKQLRSRMSKLQGVLRRVEGINQWMPTTIVRAGKVRPNLIQLEACAKNVVQDSPSGILTTPMHGLAELAIAWTHLALDAEHVQ